MSFSQNLKNRLNSALGSIGASKEFRDIYDVTTAGTAEASKALVLDSSKGATGVVLNPSGLATGAGAGVTGGAGTVYKNSLRREGNLYVTSILIDITDLQSSTTDLDIIGQGGSAAYIAKLTAAECGTTILAVRMTCLEAPATGVTDIDLYSATEGTGVFDGGIASLAETAVITAGGAWANDTVKGATTVPLSTEYLYLTCGAAGTVGTYTAGKFLIEIFGF